MRSRDLAAVAALTVLAAALRFPTLDVQSFWFDEAVTVDLLRNGLFDMLHEIPGSESTPPLYYVLAWFWSKLFGTGEVGLRSLSALFGTALVPVAYLAGAAAVSRRTGLVTAALVAINPLLVWYSQEARAYALLALLGGASLLFFLRARDGDRSSLPWWALTSALAIGTHYFAVFLVGAEGLWLLLRRRAFAAVGVVAAAGAALAPLAIDQASNNRADFIEDSSLISRVAQVPKQFLIGYDAPAEVAATAVALLLAAAGLALLLTRAPRSERSRAAVPALLAAVAVGLPVLLAIAGPDYVLSRNLITALLPAAVVLAAGYATGRAGLAAAAALCALSVGVVISVAADPEFQRDDWRGAAEEIGPAAAPRAIVVTPASGRVPLELYLPRTRTMPPAGAEVGEVVLLGLPVRRPGEEREPPAPRRDYPLSQEGLRETGRVLEETFTLVRFRAAAGRVRVTPGQLDFNRLSDAPGAVLLEAP
jgi:mannosyltransferase